MINSDSQILALIARGEDRYTEFETSIPRPDILARTIAGFANSSGGQILIGVRDDASIDGVDPEQATTAVYRAVRLLNPSPKIYTNTVPVGDKQIFVVTVEEAKRSLILAEGAAYIRTGTITAKPNRNELLGGGGAIT